MMKDSREEILRKVKLGLYGDPKHKDGNISSHDAERDFAKEAEEFLRDRIIIADRLTEQFIKELLNVNTEVREAQGEEELRDFIAGLVRKEGVSSYAIWESGYINSLGLKELLTGEGLRQIISNDKNDIAEAGVGITGADYAIADTGTLALLTDEDRPRSVSLLPPIHLAIVRKSDIVGDIKELFIILKQRLDTGQSVPSCMTFITGPSRTADIELNLTLGVHGPKELYVIII
ncbi:MAG: lactate utilization protein [Candidatus Dadabacteria bacterium]|nr:lactate utilization protein [Candidatus Dadabacteria bacterium]